ncbi:hypothetical protein B0H14DRAFT_3528726 [Mycena olivaceomarginata]|nr:hypothetical protein B0H14DRAFT_3528726 [Mycena olivaceomarginata]
MASQRSLKPEAELRHAPSKCPPSPSHNVPLAMPLFHNHWLTDVNVQGVPCPQPACTRVLRSSLLPASASLARQSAVFCQPAATHSRHHLSPAPHAGLEEASPRRRRKSVAFQTPRPARGSFHTNTSPDSKKPLRVSRADLAAPVTNAFARSAQQGICRLPRPGDLVAAIGDHNRHPPCLARPLATPPSSRMSLAARRCATRHCTTYYHAASRAHDIDDAALDGGSNGPPLCTSSRHTA